MVTTLCTVAQLRAQLGNTTALDATLQPFVDDADAIVRPFLKANLTGSWQGPVARMTAAVAAALWRAAESGSQALTFNDMQMPAGTAVTSSLLRRHYPYAAAWIDTGAWVG